MTCLRRGFMMLEVILGFVLGVSGYMIGYYTGLRKWKFHRKNKGGEFVDWI